MSTTIQPHYYLNSFLVNRLNRFDFPMQRQFASSCARIEEVIPTPESPISTTKITVSKIHTKTDARDSAKRFITFE
jgi:hypothetical protein